MTNDFMFSSVADLQKLLKGNSGSQSLAILNNVMSETIGMSMHNAVTAQQNAQMLNSATTTSTCARILAIIGAQPVPKQPEPSDVPPKSAPQQISQSTADAVA